MESSFTCYQTESADQPLKLASYTPKPLGVLDVEIKITHCGLCHTDLHIAQNDWENTEYPSVPGHEIVGNVTQVGSLVKHLKLGDRVGVGFIRESCLNCEYCLTGRDNICPDRQTTCFGGHRGGFASHIRLNSGWAHIIPESIPSELAGPLMCAGITVYQAIKANIPNPAGKKIGIAGIGGLGIMAIKFARILGAEPIAFSTSESKRKLCMDIGATKFFNCSNEADVAEAKSSVHYLLSTSSASLDWPKYFNFMKNDGKLIVCGIQKAMLSIPILDMLDCQKHVCSSGDGTRSNIKEMLDLCARYKLYPEVKVKPMSEVAECLKVMSSSKMDLRIVLQN